MEKFSLTWKFISGLTYFTKPSEISEKFKITMLQKYSRLNKFAIPYQYSCISKIFPIGPFSVFIYLSKRFSERCFLQFLYVFYRSWKDEQRREKCMYAFCWASRVRCMQRFLIQFHSFHKRFCCFLHVRRKLTHSVAERHFSRDISMMRISRMVFWSNAKSFLQYSWVCILNYKKNFTDN